MELTPKSNNGIGNLGKELSFLISLRKLRIGNWNLCEIILGPNFGEIIPFKILDQWEKLILANRNLEDYQLLSSCYRHKPPNIPLFIELHLWIG